MAKKILIIETSLRAKSNSDRHAESFAEGAKAAGNDVEIISMRVLSIASNVSLLNLPALYNPKPIKVIIPRKMLTNPKTASSPEMMIVITG